MVVVGRRQRIIAVRLVALIHALSKGGTRLLPRFRRDKEIRAPELAEFRETLANRMHTDVVRIGPCQAKRSSQRVHQIPWSRRPPWSEFSIEMTLLFRPRGQTQEVATHHE